MTCPTEAFRLRDISRAEMQTFVDSINARGNTYHDIGMIWGARFISPRGIFASDNQSAPNGDAIARHIVFIDRWSAGDQQCGLCPLRHGAC